MTRCHECGRPVRNFFSHVDIDCLNATEEEIHAHAEADALVEYKEVRDGHPER